MAAKTSKTLNKLIPSTNSLNTESRESRRPDDKTALPRADPDMAMKTMDH